MDVLAEVLKAAKAELEDAKAAKVRGLSEIDEREVGLGKKIEELDGQRTEAESKIDELTLSRYNRLVERKGANIVVGITHGACGGCHMKLPSSEVVAVKSGQQIKYCPNCGRILYYTRDMTLEEA